MVVNDSIVGIQAFGVSDTDFDDCQSNRSKAGVDVNGQPGYQDLYCGYLLGGTGRYGTYAGANASIRFTRCIVTKSIAAVDSVGAKLLGYSADTFINDFETSGIDTGIIFDGEGVTDYVTQGDIYINHPVIDDAYYGIRVSNTNVSSSIDIVSCYIAARPGGTAVRLDNARGSMTISGGQIDAFNGNMAGLIALNSSGIIVQGLRIRDALTPIYMESCGIFELRPLITNPNFPATPAGQQMVQANSACGFANCFRGLIAPVVKGMAGIFPLGIAFIGTGNNNMEAALTGIDPGCLTGFDPGLKLAYNGAPVTSSSFGSGNLRSGVTS